MAAGGFSPDLFDSGSLPFISSTLPGGPTSQWPEYGKIFMRHFKVHISLVLEEIKFLKYEYLLPLSCKFTEIYDFIHPAGLGNTYGGVKVGNQGGCFDQFAINLFDPPLRSQAMSNSRWFDEIDCC